MVQIGNNAAYLELNSNNQAQNGTVVSYLKFVGLRKFLEPENCPFDYWQIV